MELKKIIVDVCGSDLGPETILRGIREALETVVGYRLVLVGDENVIRSTLGDACIARYGVEILPSEDVITNHDAPTAVFKGREKASMVMALDRLKSDERCVGMLCAGNTGALMVGSIFRLGLNQGLRQPALASDLPGFTDRHVMLVDCGANMDCKAEDLVGFALMGEAYMRAMYAIDRPKVALLSVGREDGKGNALTKSAFELLKQQKFDFIGNIEGSDVLTGEADVVVCDGFVGNVVLKNSEAVAKYAMSLLDVKDASAETRACLNTIKRRLFDSFAYNDQGGAVFLGTKKSIVKMHGCANESTVGACLRQLIRMENNNFAASTARALERRKTAKEN